LIFPQYHFNVSLFPSYNFQYYDFLIIIIVSCLYKNACNSFFLPPNDDPNDPIYPDDLDIKYELISEFIKFIQFV
jgi:hypothetical protein